LRDYAISGTVGPEKGLLGVHGAASPDTWSPVHTKTIQKVQVAPGSEVFFPDPQASWISEVHVISNPRSGAPTPHALAPATRCHGHRLFPL
jgi:hypothetical protein